MYQDSFMYAVVTRKRPQTKNFYSLLSTYFLMQNHFHFARAIVHTYIEQFYRLSFPAQTNS